VLPASATLLPPPARCHRQCRVAVNNAIAFVLIVIVVAVIVAVSITVAAAASSWLLFFFSPPLLLMAMFSIQCCLESRGIAIKTWRWRVSACRSIVLVENLHIHGVLTSTVVDTDSDNMMEMNWRG
jgi:hypothetical protein